MRILLLNKFTAPDPAPTARLLAELAAGLEERGWEVQSLSAGGSYRQGTGSGGWRRWLKEAAAHARLLLGGCQAPRPDVILCLSDPPGLVFTASLISRIRRVPLAHWVMDVYPQIAAALGEVSSSNPAYTVLRLAVDEGYRRSQIIGCLDEDMAQALALDGSPKLILSSPWPPSQLVRNPSSLEKAADAGTSNRRPFTWLYSGNLGRAHDFETLLQAQAVLESEGVAAQLVFQGRGPQLQSAKNRAADLGLKGCTWADYAPDDQLIDSLLNADVVIATQKPETQGLLWPSKLALLKRLERPLLWIGPSDGSIAKMLARECPTCAIFAPGDSPGVAHWMRRQIRKEKSVPISCPLSTLRESLALDRSRAIDTWHHRLAELIVNYRASS